MDAILSSAILDSLAKGEVTKVIGFVLIFVFIWIEVRGLKKEFAKLNATIAKSFSDGEARFESIEGKQMVFEHRLTVLEEKRSQQ